MSSYRTGNGPQQINLTVEISTIGLAASRAIAGVPESGNLPYPIAHSVCATGDIEITPIGSADNLTGQTISIMTIVDLRTVADEKDRKAELNRINANYILDNGIEGHKIFAHDSITSSNDFATAIIYKEIQLIS